MGMIKKLSMLFLIIVLLLCTSCSEQLLSQKKLEHMLDSLPIETDETIFYVYNNKLYSNELLLDLEELLKNKKILGFVEEVFCIKDNKVYFLYTLKLQNETEKWCLASVSIPEKIITLHYEGIFCGMPDADYSYSKTIELRDYSKANGFYIDGKIVLTDKTKLTEIDILTDTICEYAYKDYKFKDIEINIRKDSKQLVFSSSNKTEIIDFEKASELSPNFRLILRLEQLKIYDGSFCLDLFFSKVQMVNNKYYIFGRILNWHGESHIVVFEYDIVKNDLIYLFNLTTYDIADHCLFVVPVFKTNQF